VMKGRSVTAMPAWVHTAQVHENPAPAPVPAPVTDRQETQTPPETKRSWSAILLVLNGACLSATLAVAVTMMLAWRPMQDLDTLDNRMARLDGIEQRLSGRVDGAADRVDRAIQGRIDRVDAGLGGLADGLGQLRVSVGQSVDTLDDTSARLDETFAGALLAITELTETANPSQNTEQRRAVKFAAQGGPPFDESLGPASPEFQRQELPDGSVAYRRVEAR